MTAVQAAVQDPFPRVLLGNWRQVRHPYTSPICRAYASGCGLRVLVSVSEELDGEVWLHVSVSRASRLPSWEDLRKVKEQFVGAEKKAIQVLPPKSEYVNQHPYCLHLFACLTKNPLPDFRRGEGL